MVGETFTGILNRNHNSGDGSRGERRRVLAISTSEFENLETVFGDGDSHALEKFVVEVRNVFVFELVLREGKTVSVDERRFKVCSREP